jgi:hypothetical protein
MGDDCLVYYLDKTFVSPDGGMKARLLKEGEE